MDEAIPGSRVRAATKHGTLTVDELAAMQPGMARLMDELSRRYWVLYYAAKAGNWELAGYMERESEKILQTASVARPKYREDIAAFLRNRFGPVASAIEAKDWRAFDAAYRYGHSQIRQTYAIRRDGPRLTVFPDLIGFGAVGDRTIDWAMMFDVPGKRRRSEVTSRPFVEMRLIWSEVIRAVRSLDSVSTTAP